MKKYVRVVLVLVIGIFASAGAVAQVSTTRVSAADKYLISAKAGGVNVTEGPVRITRVDGRSEVLLRGDQIEIGDKVETGANARAEILLNPGSYLRLGGDAAFEFKSTSLDDLQINISKGSAMFEVFATERFRVNLTTPKGEVALVDSGIYRVDLNPDGAGTISVSEGTAIVGNIIFTEVKAGHVAPIRRGSVKVAKFDRSKRDELAEWSKNRAKDLAKMTAALNNSNMRNALANSFYRGSWNLYDSFGLWVCDATRKCYFSPFGRSCYSPYGYNYGPGIGVQPGPSGIYLHKDQKGTQGPVATGSRGQKGDGPPPFTAIERQQQTRSGFGYGGSNGGGWPGAGDPGSGRGSQGDSRQTSTPAYNPPQTVREIAPVNIPSKTIKP